MSPRGYQDLRVEIADGVATLTLDRDEVGRRETAYHHLVMGRPDALEGVMSFLERRPPRWALAVPRDWPDSEDC